MGEKIRAIDADGHVHENLDGLRERLEPPYDRYYTVAPVGTGSLITPDDGAPRGLAKLGGVGDNPAVWLDMMAQGDLDKAILFPTNCLAEGMIRDPDAAVALCRAYNGWLAEDFCNPEQGLLGVALLPTQDPEEAVKEVRRAKGLGLVGAMFAADGPNLMGHRRYDPVYQAAADEDLPVSLHASGTSLADACTGASDFPKFIQAHSISHPFGIIRQFTSMMLEGVFERFPTVRFGFLECGGTWAPWYLDRLDEEFEHRGEEEAPNLTRMPSSFVHEGGNIFFGCEAEERLLGPTLDAIGRDTVMYASDWPHWDGDYPNSLWEMEQREDLTEDQRAGVLRDAAVRFYGF